MAERMSHIQFAAMALMDLAEAERIGVALAVLTASRDPFTAPVLLDAGHKIARHADALARSSLGAGVAGGPCRPETAAAAVRPTSPDGMGMPSGAFPTTDIGEAGAPWMD